MGSQSIFCPINEKIYDLNEKQTNKLQKLVLNDFKHLKDPMIEIIHLLKNELVFVKKQKNEKRETFSL